MNIHPTSGGVAPLYSPCGPSLLSVCIRQSSGPLNCDICDVCNLTLIVSKGCPTVALVSCCAPRDGRCVQTCQLGDAAEDAADEAFVVSRGLRLIGQLGLTIMVTARQRRCVCRGSCCRHVVGWRREKKRSGCYCFCDHSGLQN
jgi:hypothetical protein